jgi:hypothetical protein
MTNYVIRVQGALSTELTDSFPSLEAEPVAPGTVLHGELADQAALGAVLAHLDMLGVEILEVLQVPSASGTGGRIGLSGIG